MAQSLCDALDDVKKNKLIPNHAYLGSLGEFIQLGNNAETSIILVTLVNFGNFYIILISDPKFLSLFANEVPL